MSLIKNAGLFGKLQMETVNNFDHLLLQVLLFLFYLRVFN